MLQQEFYLEGNSEMKLWQRAREKYGKAEESTDKFLRWFADQDWTLLAIALAATALIVWVLKS